MGNPLLHFTLQSSLGLAGVNLFAQDLAKFTDMVERPYVFPPRLLVDPVLRFLVKYQLPYVNTSGPYFTVTLRSANLRVLVIPVPDFGPPKTVGVLRMEFRRTCGDF